MVFSSVIFIFYFLPMFLLGYYISGWRTGALLVGSVAFYTWGEGAYVALLLALIALNYAGSLWIENAAPGKRRTLLLASLVSLDFCVLGFFKYSAFVSETLDGLLGRDLFPVQQHTLPLGISFFTFQLVSYGVDVFRGSVKAERDPVRFAAYILMFPHLIAGPIVRYADIRDEMHAYRRKSGHIGLGIQYFIVGLCQKVLIANTVAPSLTTPSRPNLAVWTPPGPGWGFWPTRCRSISTSAAIRTWPSAWRSSWASPSRRTLTTPTSPSRSPSSGAAGRLCGTC
jgi:alginate O-acetyltransferase complex protein AlgI